MKKSSNKVSFNPFDFANAGFLDFRRFVLDVFPYKIFYLLKNDVIIIAAIIHKSRSDRYWRKKLKKRK